MYKVTSYSFHYTAGGAGYLQYRLENNNTILHKTQILQPAELSALAAMFLHPNVVLNNGEFIAYGIARQTSISQHLQIV